MINPVMPKLSFISPPEYKSYSSYREYLRKSANYACAYCTISESESPGATFNIDHFRPKKYFPQLSVQCTNLRYSCPRCNSYKGDLWISQSDGCMRNCERCKQSVCKENINRFVDTVLDDPSEIILLKDDMLYASSMSKPANYTITYLRLNRAQLIKLRHVRRFMYNWFIELESKRREAIKLHESMLKIQRDYAINLESNICKNENNNQNAIAIMYEMMVLLTERSVILIEAEIKKLSYLRAQSAGCDELISCQE